MAPRKTSSKATASKPAPLPAAEAGDAAELAENPTRAAGIPEADAEPAGRKSAAKPRTRKSTAAKAAPEPAAEPAPKEAPKPAKPARAAKTPAKTPAKATAKARAAAEPAVEPAAGPEAAEPAASFAAPSVAPAAEGLTAQAGAILEAIQDGRAVELLFLDADANPPRTFEPRQLIFDVFARGWYVWGWDRRYNAERHHLLSLVAQVNPVEGMGRAAQGPYKDGTPANQVGGWLGGEPIHVRAVLLKQWIFAVRQAPAPFPDFAIEDLEEGKAQITFTATDLRAITRWVMQFGDGIQILEPQRLLDRIKQVGLAWAGKPAQAAPAPVPAPAPKPPAPAPRPAAPRASSQRHSDRQSERQGERQSEHKAERQSEHKAERHSERQAEHRSEAAQERRSHEGSKPAKPAKFEIRIDRL